MLNNINKTSVCGLAFRQALLIFVLVGIQYFPCYFNFITCPNLYFTQIPFTFKVKIQLNIASNSEILSEIIEPSPIESTTM